MTKNACHSCNDSNCMNECGSSTPTASPLRLVERRLFYISFQAKENFVRTDGSLFRSGKCHYTRLVAADTIDEAVKAIEQYAAYHRVEYKGDQLPPSLPKYYDVLVETVIRRAAYFIPEGLVEGQAFSATWSCRPERGDYRDNKSVKVVAKDFGEAFQIAKDYSEQDEEVIFHGLNHDGHVFVGVDRVVI